MKEGKKSTQQTINERYQVERPLGEGGSGQVFLVRDLLSKEENLFALKLLHLKEEHGKNLLTWFKREFHTLSTLRHPGLARVYDFGRERESGQPFYTSEFVAGNDLFVATREQTLETKLRILRRLCQAIDYIHTKGVLHNDLKPSNVLVDEKSLQPKLLDFGLSHLFHPLPKKENNKKDNLLYGTPGYVAPEIIRGESPSFQSDLFSLGMVFYKVFAGRLPHANQSTPQILKMQLDCAFPNVREFAADLHPELESLTMSLLARDVKDRPRSVQEVMTRLTLLMGEVSESTSSDLSQETLNYIESARLIGRERELRSLQNYIQGKIPKLIEHEKTLFEVEVLAQSEMTFADLDSGATQTGFAILHGSSGLGKSFLLTALKHQVQLLDIPFLLIECRQYQTVFASCRRMLHEVYGFLRPHSPVAEDFRDFLTYLDSFAEKGEGEFANLDRSGFFLKISQFLTRAFAERPYVIAFDDLEGADELLVSFIKHLNRLQSVQRKMVLPPIISTFRDPDVAQKLFPGKNLWVSLTPFAKNQIRELLSEAFTPQAFPENLAERIGERCHGNPQFIRELLRELISSQTLIRRSGLWNLHEIDAGKVTIPLSLIELSEKRLQTLSAYKKEILSYLAIWGEPISHTYLQMLPDHGREDFREAIRDLSQLEILRRDEAQQLVFTQETFAEVVRKNLQQVAEKHRRVAELLEKEKPKPAERLARHYREAGENESASRYALQAARAAERLFAQEHALGLYQLAYDQAQADASAKEHFIPALAGIAHIQWFKGERAAALSLYEKLLASSDAESHVQERSEAWRTLGIAKRDSGDYLAAVDCFKKCIAELGRKEPATRAEMSAQVGFVYLRENNPQAAQEWKEKALSLVTRQGDYSLSSVPILNLVAGIESAAGQLRQAQSLYEKSLEISDKNQDRRGSAVALNNLGALHAREGKFDLALEGLEKSLMLARQMGDARRTCNSLNNVGNLEYLRGSYRKAAAYFFEAHELALQIDNQPLLATLKTALGQLETDRGNYAMARIYLDEAAGLRKHLRDQKGIVYVYQGYAQLETMLGRFTEAQKFILKALRHDVDEEIRFKLLVLQSEAFLRVNNRSDATTSMDQARTLLEKRDINAQVLFALVESEFFVKNGELKKAKECLMVFLPRANQIHDRVLFLRLQLMVLYFRAFDEKSLLSEIERLLEDLRALENPELLWRAQALLAHVLEKQGLMGKAIDSYKKTREILLHLAHPLEGSIREVFLSDEEKKSIFSSIERLSMTSEFMTDELRELRKQNDQLQRLLSINRQLTAGWKNRDSLLDYILDTALDLMKAKRGFLVLWKKSELRLAAARNLSQEPNWNPENEFSRAIAEEVHKTGVAQVLMDAGSDPAFQTSKSVFGLKLRSVICVPLKLATQILGVIYLDHDQVRGLFTKGEVDLLTSLADQATLTLYQSEAYGSLQQNVDETTKELQRMQAISLEQAKALEWKYSYARIVGGKDPAMKQIFELLDRVIPTHVSVLIQGESGTGKELVAQAIHYNGPRKEKPFISINCAGISPALLESEFFGHVKGAFTSADSNKDGLFLLASEGTIFLDEMADMPADMQAKLLRVLQEKEIRPVGSEKSIKVDARVIAASNKPLSLQVSKGLFREDLYYRLNVVQIDLPPLRERREDLDLLIDTFISTLSKKKDGKLRELTSRARKTLHRYSWPGNVRELYHAFESVIALHARKKIDAEDLPEHISQAVMKTLEDVVDLETARERFTSRYLKDLLEMTGGNISEAARKAGVYRESLHRMLRKFEIKV